MQGPQTEVSSEKYEVDCWLFLYIGDAGSKICNFPSGDNATSCGVLAAGVCVREVEWDS